MNKKGSDEGVVFIIGLMFFLVFGWILLNRYYFHSDVYIPQIVFGVLGVIGVFTFLYTGLKLWDEDSGATKLLRLLCGVALIYFFVLPFLASLGVSVEAMNMITTVLPPLLGTIFGFLSGILMFRDAYKLR